MNTMRIATPVGYSSRPPRRVWPVVLGMGLLLGVGGGILSVTCFGHDAAVRSGEAEARTEPATESRPPTIGSAAASSESRPPTIGSAAASNESRPPTIGSASAPSTDGARAPEMPQSGKPVKPTFPVEPAAPAERAAPAATVHTAHLTIESVPTGAAVKGPRGAALG